MNEELATTPSPAAVGLRYGLIIGFILVLYSLLLYLTELNENTVLSWLGGIILFAGIVLAYKQFRQENMGFMSYGQGLGIGTVLGAVVGLLSGIFIAVYTKFIDPTIMQKAMDKQVEQMESRGLSDAQIEQSLEYANMFSGPVAMILMSILVYLIGAFFLSLIIAAIMKRSRPEFE
jgi:hypothetical protein